MLSKNSLDQVEKADPDRCRAAIFAHSDIRSRLLGLYAFHHQLAQIPESVSEPMLGAIRYQWWREAVDDIYGGKPAKSHDVLTAFERLYHECPQMSRYWVDRLINGRERDLDPTPFSTLEAAIDYCDETSGVLMMLATSVCEVEEISEDYLVLGRAWGLTGLARSYRYYQNSMLSQIDHNAICEAANTAYHAARNMQISPDIMPACAYIGLIPGYISRLCRDDFNPQTDEVVYSPLSKKIAMMKTVLTGRL